jgi:hypothetical protein
MPVAASDTATTETPIFKTRKRPAPPTTIARDPSHYDFFVGLGWRALQSMQWLAGCLFSGMQPPAARDGSGIRSGFNAVNCSRGCLH